MGLAITTAIAFSIWIILASLGRSSFDGFLLALLIVLIAAGTGIVRRPGGTSSKFD